MFLGSFGAIDLLRLGNGPSIQRKRPLHSSQTTALMLIRLVRMMIGMRTVIIFDFALPFQLLMLIQGALCMGPVSEPCILTVNLKSKLLCFKLGSLPLRFERELIFILQRSKSGLADAEAPLLERRVSFFWWSGNVGP